jgi:16S rRNA (cytosine967-C5)-methyltransferase
MRWLVLMGLCQLFILRQAEHAAVSETVRLAPQRVRGVVNGMLRNAARRRHEFEAECEKLPLAVRYSTPTWLVRRWTREFGEAETRAMPAGLLQVEAKGLGTGGNTLFWAEMSINVVFRRDKTIELGGNSNA